MHRTPTRRLTPERFVVYWNEFLAPILHPTRPRPKPSNAGTVEKMKKAPQELTIEQILESLPLPPLEPEETDPLMRKVAQMSSITALGVTSKNSTSITQNHRTGSINQSHTLQTP